MARVELKSIKKVYPGGIEAVKGIDLVVEDKEFVVLVGPSGCGKSTTLRMVAGLEEISGGQVSIDDKVVNDVAPKDRDIAMVFQNYALYPHMTVYKNMAFGLQLRKYPKEEIDKRVQNAAKILGITELLDRRPKALSGGQRQRVAVGRAIVRNPKVFLFDEPLSNLDAKLRVQMRAEISKLHRRLKSTMIYVTHDQVEAMTMGDRIVVMLDGVIQQIATPMALYHKPANMFVGTFIGSPPMNLISGTLVNTGSQLHFQSDDGSMDLRVPQSREAALVSYAGKAVTLGLRPEDILDNHDQIIEHGKSIQAMVDVVEPLGGEVHVHFQLADTAITANLKAVDPPMVGVERIFNINMENAHFFDSKTEEAIS